MGDERGGVGRDEVASRAPEGGAGRTYFARSDPKGLPPEAAGATWQSIAAHLSTVAELAQGRALSAAPDDERFAAVAQWAGLFHDLGKYTDAFQRRLRAASVGETADRVEHSGHGAAVAAQRKLIDAAFAIAGHHAGLPKAKGDASSLAERVKRVQTEAEALLSVASADLARHGCALPPENLSPPPGSPRDSTTELAIRMLASVVVDADRLDAAGCDTAERTLHDASTRLERLLAVVSERSDRVRNTAVREARRDTLNACLAAAEWDDRFLSLTVPTGGGKTFAATAFALKRAALRPLDARRVIYVVPYLSIIEQNAKVLAAAVGEDAILEHHSGELLGEAMRADEGAPLHGGLQRDAWLARENWNAPVVVTTSVRFFDTLFSNRPADLRRLHAIARSVVILDEVQTLPRDLIGPILTMLRDLCDRWRTTIVLCTATQPAFERGERKDDRRLKQGTVREIAPPSLDLFGRLRRVAAAWPGQGAEPARVTWDEVAERLASEDRGMCIVNTTRHARALFQLLAARVDPRSCWHLSARMCPLHRLQVLHEIREALARGGPCRVVATQVVEAGVNLDFPVVFRAMAPLDSIVQAAGRCDREGELSLRAGHPAGRLVVFEPVLDSDSDGPPGVYREATGITRRLSASGLLDLDGAATVHRYFDELYGNPPALDANDIDACRARLDFPAVAEKFQLIPDDSSPIVVEWTAEVGAALRHVAAARCFVPEHRRLLQRASVSIRAGELQQVKRTGAVYELFEHSDLWIASSGAYRDDVGFVGCIEMPLIA